MLRPHADMVKALKSRAGTWRMTVGAAAMLVSTGGAGNNAAVVQQSLHACCAAPQYHWRRSTNVS
jgi:hypothetical protein